MNSAASTARYRAAQAEKIEQARLREARSQARIEARNLQEAENLGRAAMTTEELRAEASQKRAATRRLNHQKKNQQTQEEAVIDDHITLFMHTICLLIGPRMLILLRD